MELKYYVLGMKNNPLLIESLEKYYLLLLEKLNSFDFLGKNEILFIQNRDFLLSPDISSIIEVLSNNGEKYAFLDKNNLKNILEQEVKYFLNGKFQNFSSNKGQNIGNTNIKLTTYDLNPLNILDEHPDHNKNDTIGWGIMSEEKWLEVYCQVFEILKQTDIGFYEELNFIIKKIIPIGTVQNVHNSASYAECIGHLYMGYTLDTDILPALVLEAIIHESSHNKLNLLHKFDNIVNNDYTLTYYSPYRPDARHIWGIFLGIHALIPTVYVLLNAYNKGLLKSDDLLKKILIYNKKNMLGIKVIQKYADLTFMGNEILQELLYIIKITNSILSKINIDTSLNEIATEENKKHLLQVIQNYPYLKY